MKRTLPLRWPGLAALLTAAILVTGCQTTASDTSRSDGSGEDTAGESASERRAGGNVRSTPFLPPVPSEVESADYRYW